MDKNILFNFIIDSVCFSEREPYNGEKIIPYEKMIEELLNSSKQIGIDYELPCTLSDPSTQNNSEPDLIFSNGYGLELKRLVSPNECKGINNIEKKVSLELYKEKRISFFDLIFSLENLSLNDFKKIICDKDFLFLEEYYEKLNLTEDDIKMSIEFLNKVLLKSKNDKKNKNVLFFYPRKILQNNNCSLDDICNFFKRSKLFEFRNDNLIDKDTFFSFFIQEENTNLIKEYSAKISLNNEQKSERILENLFFVVMKFNKESKALEFIDKIPLENSSFYKHFKVENDLIKYFRLCEDKKGENNE